MNLPASRQPRTCNRDVRHIFAILPGTDNITWYWHNNLSFRNKSENVQPGESRNSLLFNSLFGISQSFFYRWSYGAKKSKFGIHMPGNLCSMVVFAAGNSVCATLLAAKNVAAICDTTRLAGARPRNALPCEIWLLKMRIWMRTGRHAFCELPNQCVLTTWLPGLEWNFDFWITKVFISKNLFSKIP